MKKLYFVILFSLAVTNASAQIPPEVNVVWQYNSRGFSENNIVDNYIVQPDSSLVFSTAEVMVDSVTLFPSINFFLWKINLNGVAVIEHKDPMFPADMVRTTRCRFFIKATPSGHFIIVIQAGRTYVAEYDSNLNLTWGKYVNNDHANILMPRTIETVEILSSGNIVIASSYVDHSLSRPVPVGTALLGLNSDGDSLFTAINHRPGNNSSVDIINITAGRNNTFADRTSFIQCCGLASFRSLSLRSGFNGSILAEHLVPSNSDIISNVAFQPLTGNFRVLTVNKDNVTPYPGPNDFFLHAFDDKMDYKGETVFSGITSISSSSINSPFMLTESHDGGHFIFQHFDGYFGHEKYIFLARLDSLANPLWSFRAEEPASIIAGVKKIIPLAGNDFLACAEGNHGIEVFRMSADFSTSSSAIQSFSRQPNFLNKKESDVSRLVVKVAPNPSNRLFTLMIKSNSDQPIFITVTDISGRVVDRKSNIAGNSVIQVGGNFRRGIYVVQVTQGKQKEQLKLVKF